MLLPFPCYMYRIASRKLRRPASSLFERGGIRHRAKGLLTTEDVERPYPLEPNRFLHSGMRQGTPLRIQFLFTMEAWR